MQVVRPQLIKIATNFGLFAFAQAKKLGYWGLPAALGGAWLVWPAVSAKM